MQTQSKREITFDTLLKAALTCVINRVVFQDSCNKFVVPHDVMKFSEGRTSRIYCDRVLKNVALLFFQNIISLAGSILSKIDVHNPVFDYIPPELVNLCISNM